MFELLHKKLDLANKKLDLLLQRQQIEERELSIIRQMEIKEMSSIDDLVAEVANETTEIASVFTSLQANSAGLADAIATPGSGG